MRRTSWLVCLLFLAGCQVPTERVPIMPLPEGGEPAPYLDIVQRARFQAAAANEAFYVDKWTDLADTAEALEKTINYLPKTSEVPERLKTGLPARVTELTKLCGQLRDAAKARDVKKTNDTLQQINLKVRELRPES